MVEFHENQPQPNLSRRLPTRSQTEKWSFWTGGLIVQVINYSENTMHGGHCGGHLRQVVVRAAENGGRRQQLEQV